jgi:hypothetical protein
MLIGERLRRSGQGEGIRRPDGRKAASGRLNALQTGLLHIRNRGANKGSYMHGETYQQYCERLTRESIPQPHVRRYTTQHVADLLGVDWRAVKLAALDDVVRPTRCPFTGEDLFSQDDINTIHDWREQQRIARAASELRKIEWAAKRDRCRSLAETVKATGVNRHKVEMLVLMDKVKPAWREGRDMRFDDANIRDIRTLAPKVFKPKSSGQYSHRMIETR